MLSCDLLTTRLLHTFSLGARIPRLRRQALLVGPTDMANQGTTPAPKSFPGIAVGSLNWSCCISFLATRGWFLTLWLLVLTTLVVKQGLMPLWWAGRGEGRARCDELTCFADLGQKHQNTLTKTNSSQGRRAISGPR